MPAGRAVSSAKATAISSKTERIASRLSIYWPLASVVVAGTILRLTVMATYSSSVFLFQIGDATRYARLPIGGAPTGLFSDFASPAGYPILLAFLRKISTALPFTVLVQHALGVLTALVLYAAARRFGAPQL
jgi:hypothetical protein